MLKKRKEKLLMTQNIEIENHPLTPFLPQNGRLLMLGSFPPQQKRWCMNFYYPNFSNDMWRVFGLVFFNDPIHFVDTQFKQFKKDKIIDFLQTNGIGLYDTACAVRRLQDNASDKFLEIVKATDIESLLLQMPDCHAIVTTGQKATDTICEHFQIKQPKMGSCITFEMKFATGNLYRLMTLYRMPSTSRAYPLSLQKKAEIYKLMFQKVFK